MFSFLLDGSLGGMLAPQRTVQERFLDHLDRQQEDAALALLQSVQCGDAEPFDLNVPGVTEKRPIHAASECGFSAVIQEMLNLGVDIEARDSQGRTALLLGSMHGHPQVSLRTALEQEPTSAKKLTRVAPLVLLSYFYV